MSTKPMPREPARRCRFRQGLAPATRPATQGPVLAATANLTRGRQPIGESRDQTAGELPPDLRLRAEICAAAAQACAQGQRLLASSHAITGYGSDRTGARGRRSHVAPCNCRAAGFGTRKAVDSAKNPSFDT